MGSGKGPVRPGDEFGLYLVDPWEPEPKRHQEQRQTYHEVKLQGP